MAMMISRHIMSNNALVFLYTAPIFDCRLLIIYNGWFSNVYNTIFFLYTVSNVVLLPHVFFSNNVMPYCELILVHHMNDDTYSSILYFSFCENVKRNHHEPCTDLCVMLNRRQVTDLTFTPDIQHTRPKAILPPLMC